MFGGRVEVLGFVSLLGVCTLMIISGSQHSLSFLLLWFYKAACLVN